MQMQMAEARAEARRSGWGTVSGLWNLVPADDHTLRWSTCCIFCHVDCSSSRVVFSRYMRSQHRRRERVNDMQCLRSKLIIHIDLTTSMEVQAAQACKSNHYIQRRTYDYPTSLLFNLRIIFIHLKLVRYRSLLSIIILIDSVQYASSRSCTSRVAAQEV